MLNQMISGNLHATNRGLLEWDFLKKYVWAQFHLYNRKTLWRRREVKIYTESQRDNQLKESCLFFFFFFSDGEKCQQNF